MNRFLSALEFLTVFRIRRTAETAYTDIGAALPMFPLVGAVQGAVLAGLAYLLSFILPWGAVPALLILALILTNAGLHLDGVADTIDGLAGGATPEERLRIMKDSSTGALGAAAIAVLLIIKYSALRETPEAIRLPAVFLMPIAGRWAVAPMAYLSAYARKEAGLGRPFAKASGWTLLKATLIAGALFWLALGGLSLLILLFLGFSAYFFTAFFKRRLGGVTGDVFGFQSEACEALFLLVLLAFQRLDVLGWGGAL